MQISIYHIDIPLPLAQTRNCTKGSKSTANVDMNKFYVNITIVIKIFPRFEHTAVTTL